NLGCTNPEGAFPCLRDRADFFDNPGEHQRASCGSKARGRHSAAVSRCPMLPSRFSSSWAREKGAHSARLCRHRHTPASHCPLPSGLSPSAPGFHRVSPPKRSRGLSPPVGNFTPPREHHSYRLGLNKGLSSETVRNSRDAPSPPRDSRNTPPPFRRGQPPPHLRY